jgi:integrase
MVAAERVEMNWFDFACAFADATWKRAAPKHRQGIAEALATATPALLRTEGGKPEPRLLRRALNEWAFNTGRRRAGPPPKDLAEATEWVRRNTLAVSAMEDAQTARAVLDALAFRLDGQPPAAKTVSRKRATIYNAMEYAVEVGHLDGNPLSRIKWTPPRSTEALDRRSVVNHGQARALLAGVAERGETGRRLVAFFGCMYYAAMRPAEATALAVANLVLPDPEDRHAWGELHLGAPPRGQQRVDRFRTPRDAPAQAPGAQRGPRRALHPATRAVAPCPSRRVRYRARRAPVPCAEEWRAHLGVGVRPHLADGSGGRADEAEAASPFARRPYDLRHAAVLTWLNAGVPATQVAEWAGHSVHVLLRVYAKCIVGQDELARRRIEDAIREDDDGQEAKIVPS